MTKKTPYNSSYLKTTTPQNTHLSKLVYLPSYLPLTSFLDSGTSTQF